MTSGIVAINSTGLSIPRAGAAIYAAAGNLLPRMPVGSCWLLCCSGGVILGTEDDPSEQTSRSCPSLRSG